MSIINDALKKAQNNNNNQKNASDKTPPTPPPNGQNKDGQQKPNSKKLRLILLILLLIGIGVAIVLTKPELFSNANLQKLTTTNSEFKISAIKEKINNIKTIALEKATSISTLIDETNPEPENQPKTQTPVDEPAPTQPLSQKIVTPDITISGIMKIDDKYVALIQDDVYEEGHVIKGATIKEISERNVVLNFQGEQFQLGINQ